MEYAGDACPDLPQLVNYFEKIINSGKAPAHSKNPAPTRSDNPNADWEFLKKVGIPGPSYEHKVPGCPILMVTERNT